MANQVSDLVTSIRKRAKDLTFDESLLIEWINTVNHDVLTHNRFRFMENDGDDTISFGDTELELDDDVDTILSLKLNENGTNTADFSPTYVHYNTFLNDFNADIASNGSPTYYTLFNNTILFNIPADKTYKVSYKYLAAPTLITDLDQEPDIPERFNEIIKLGVLAMVEDYRDNFDIASIRTRQMEEKVEDMVARLSIRQLQKAPKASFGGYRRS